MKINATFKNVRVYDIDHLDVLKGEAFSIDYEFDPTETAQNVNLFANNDPVLIISQVGKSGAVMSADNVGSSTILFMPDNFVVTKILTINVEDSIQAPAVTLDPSASQPEQK